MKKIDLIVGARPNFIKAFPVYRALEKTGQFSLRLINTGQHYDKNMADVFFEQLKMKKPDINLGIGSGRHGEQTARILDKIEREFLSEKPDLVIVFGDVNSTLAAALAAAKLHIPVAHVEAGLRSFDRSMPEEINRVLTDQISDLLFITSPEAEVNLLKEGKDKDQINFVGNTMIDSLGYLEFMGLQRDAAAVITDSGGIQEESTFLGVPCLTVRDNTERPITIEQGTNRLVGTEYSNIPEIVKDLIVEKSVPRVPELWDGKSSERIANVLQSC